MNHPSLALLCITLLVSSCLTSAEMTPQQEPQVQMVNRVYMAVVNIRIDGGRGSGFFISTDGHIVTNAHVIRGASNITVLTQDGQSLKAKVIGQNRDVDLALLKVEPTRPPTIIPLAKESPNMIGQTMVVIGNPLGVGTSVTRGILGGRGRAPNSVSPTTTPDGQPSHLSDWNDQLPGSRTKAGASPPPRPPLRRRYPGTSRI